MDEDSDMLFVAVAENTRRILPPTVRNMNEIIAEMFKADGMSEEMVQMMIGDIDEEHILFLEGTGSAQLNAGIGHISETARIVSKETVY